MMGLVKAVNFAVNLTIVVYIIFCVGSFVLNDFTLPEDYFLHISSLVMLGCAKLALTLEEEESEQTK